MSKMMNATVTVKREITGILLKERSDRLSNLIIDQLGFEADKKATASSFKKKIDELDKEIGEISHNLQQGYELIEQPCKKRKNYTQSVWEFFDDLTDELIKTEPFTESDYQSSIDDYEE